MKMETNEELKARADANRAKAKQAEKARKNGHREKHFQAVRTSNADYDKQENKRDPEGVEPVARNRDYETGANEKEARKIQLLNRFEDKAQKDREASNDRTR